MGLIECIVCGKEISDRAMNCPFCNSVIKKEGTHVKEETSGGIKKRNDIGLKNKIPRLGTDISNIEIFVDQATGVQYFFGNGVMCPRYNADGSLYIEEGTE